MQTPTIWSARKPDGPGSKCLKAFKARLTCWVMIDRTLDESFLNLRKIELCKCNFRRAYTVSEVSGSVHSCDIRRKERSGIQAINSVMATALASSEFTRRRVVLRGVSANLKGLIKCFIKVSMSDSKNAANKRFRSIFYGGVWRMTKRFSGRRAGRSCFRELTPPSSCEPFFRTEWRIPIRQLCKVRCWEMSPFVTNRT